MLILALYPILLNVSFVIKESSKEMREYLFEAYNTECVDYCGRVWTVTKAVEFCSKLQSLDKDMLYALYVEAKKHRSEE